MAALKFIRTRAATLTESVIALTLISFVFALATTFFVQMTKGHISQTELMAEKTLENYRISTHVNKAFYDEESANGDYHIRRTVSEYNENAMVISYSIYNKQYKALGAFREIIAIISKDEEN